MGLQYLFGVMHGVFFFDSNSLWQRVLVCLVLVSDFPTWLPMAHDKSSWSYSSSLCHLCWFFQFELLPLMYKSHWHFQWPCATNSMPNHAKRVRKEASWKVVGNVLHQYWSHSGFFSWDDFFFLLSRVVCLRLADVRVVFNVFIRREHAMPWCFRSVHKTC